MTGKEQDPLSDWLDAGRCGDDESGRADVEQGELASQLVVHGILRDTCRHNDVADEKRIERLLTAVERQDHLRPVRTDQAVDRNEVSGGKQRRRNRALAVAGSLGLAACLLIAFVVFQPGQLSAAAALERIIQSASRSSDRAYEINVLEEYRQRRKPQNLSEQQWLAETDESVDGAVLYVGGMDRHVFVRTLHDGREKKSGCDGDESWAFREDGPVHVSDDLTRWRGKVPGQQQSMAFADLYSQLTSLRDGYDVELSESTDRDSQLGRLVANRKSRDIRGPKTMEILFDRSNGAIRHMVLDGLPRGHGGPKKVELVLVSEEPLDDEFYSHAFHHDGQRKIKREDAQR